MAKADRPPRPDPSKITAPATPSPEPDPRTEQERQKGEKSQRSLTPSERHAASVERHIQDLMQQRERLQTECTRLQSELDRLRPDHERLKEAFAAALAGNIFSTVLVALGGSLISAAGYAKEPTLILVVLVAGVVTLVWGLAFLITATVRSQLMRSNSEDGRTANRSNPRP